jgi:phospholipid/cholesterol/gamma-HCH transport system substrate-binding protein
LKQNSAFEILLSAAVIIVAVGFFLFAYTSTGGASLSDYAFTVRLHRADGLKAGSDVRIGGVKVGDISSLALDHYVAVAQVRLHDDVKVPVDSGLSISSDGLTPGSYLVITPGRSSSMLQPGGTLNGK